jgi:hypothetical protein
MNSSIRLLTLVLFALITTLGLTNCSDSSSPESTNGEYLETLNEGTMQKTLSTISTGELDQAEIDGLLFMREEEKMARDVYLNLFEMYGLRVFNNISRSEQIHMNAIKYLLDRYELEDPAEGNDIGVFTNPDIQELYNNLMASATVDEIEALKVGALIEETDIADLQIHIEEIVDNDDILFVYRNLLRGSTHHLRAFVFNLRVRGIEYEPQILDRIIYMDYITD